MASTPETLSIFGRSRLKTVKILERDQDLVMILEIKTYFVALRGLLLIFWPDTPGLTTSVHRGLPDAAIPIRDPGFTRHELFTIWLISSPQ